MILLMLVFNKAFNADTGRSRSTTRYSSSPPFSGVRYVSLPQNTFAAGTTLLSLYMVKHFLYLIPIAGN